MLRMISRYVSSILQFVSGVIGRISQSEYGHLTDKRVTDKNVSSFNPIEAVGPPVARNPSIHHPIIFKSAPQFLIKDKDNSFSRKLNENRRAGPRVADY